jgi:hypothetical protein
MKRAGQPVRELFAENETDFFVDDARPLTFSDSGGAGQLTLFQRDGASTIAHRTQDQPQPILREVEPARLDRYAGRYRMPDGGIVEITRAGDRMFARLTGQGALEILPLSDTRFTYLLVEAEIVFHMSDDGRTTRLELVQNGVTTPAVRLVAD